MISMYHTHPFSKCFFFAMSFCRYSSKFVFEYRYLALVCCYHDCLYLYEFAFMFCTHVRGLLLQHLFVRKGLAQPVVALCNFEGKHVCL